MIDTVCEFIENYWLLIVPVGWGVAGIYCTIDLEKNRRFSSRDTKWLYNFLIAFPPFIGTLLYYILVMRRNKFAKATRK